MKKYYPPNFHQLAFHCPHCHVYSNQEWSSVYYYEDLRYKHAEEYAVSKCYHCNRKAFWLNEKLIIPETTMAPAPHEDLPVEIFDDFMEAASIVHRSPRGAAALLRLALQKLMKELGESGTDINKDIGSLVKKGLHPHVQQALDIVRVVGNESVHPGTLDLKDDTATATQLFELINFIVEDRITRPKSIQSLFDNLPQGKKDGITSRDSVKTP
jgi:hypothetical protein